MSDALLLAIETSGRAGSVALAKAGALLRLERLDPQRRNAAGLLPAIADLLTKTGHAPADVSIVAFSRGPGSFTGLRVAATLARMWQATRGCRVIGVPSLEAIALAAATALGRNGRIAVLMDAKRGQVFAGLFTAQRAAPAAIDVSTLEAPALRDPRPWLSQIERPLALAGDATAAFAEAGEEVIDAAAWTPTAAHVATIGARMLREGRPFFPDEIVPLYLRPPECEEVYEERRAAARARRESQISGPPT